MTEEPDVTTSTLPPHRPVLRWSSRTAVAAVALTLLACAPLLAGREGTVLTIAYAVVLGGIYAAHVWLVGWRVVVAFVLAAPGLFVAGMAVMGASERDDVALLVVVVLVTGLLVWGSSAVALWVRNRWGNTDGAVYHLF